jgi:hypothetical protein
MSFQALSPMIDNISKKNGFTAIIGQSVKALYKNQSAIVLGFGSDPEFLSTSTLVRLQNFCTKFNFVNNVP